MDRDQHIQEQIDELNVKLDKVLDFVEYQYHKREEFDDLVKDVSIVTKDAFQHTVQTLDRAGIELDTCGLDCLMVKLAGNLGTFVKMIDMLESFHDLMKDITPILHQVGLDTIEKFHEFQRKGYIDFVIGLGRLAERFMQSFTAEDLKRIESEMETITSALKNITDPEVLAGINRITSAVKEINMDEQRDNVSWWKIMMRLKSPEVRKSLSYSIRLIEAIHKKN